MKVFFGIVAGRIKEKYNVPTIIMTKGKDMPKGICKVYRRI